MKTQIVSHCAKLVFLQNFEDVKNEVFEKKFAFLVLSFYVGEIETEKNGKGPKPYKNVFF